jgi:regulatory ArsR family protein
MDLRSDEALNRAAAPGGHPPRPPVRLRSRVQIEAVAEIFQALGDPQRLRLLVRLAEGEACVSELAEHDTRDCDRQLRLLEEASAANGRLHQGPT